MPIDLYTIYEINQQKGTYIEYSSIFSVDFDRLLIFYHCPCQYSYQCIISILRVCVSYYVEEHILEIHTHTYTYIYLI
jgi:hypothetical protein